MFKVNNLYSRKDIYELLNVEKTGGNWNTGYNNYEDNWYIFANISTSGRTGHDYNNHWIGNRLYWKGKTNSKINHDSIQDMINGNSRVHIFTRTDSNITKFTYQGKGSVYEVEDRCLSSKLSHLI